MAKTSGKAAGKPRRRKPAGGYPRGEETYGRIIDAAIRVFGEEGYARASTRRIADEAGVKPPALQYYFDSKDGLHLACAEQVLSHAAGALMPAVKAAKAVLTQPTPETATAALGDLLDAVLDASIASAKTPGRSMFMSRLQADGVGPALVVIREQLMRPLHTLCARLTCVALGQKAVNDEIRVRSSTIFGQLMAFNMGRNNTLALLGWDNFEGPRRNMIKRILREHTYALLRMKPPGA